MGQQKTECTLQHVPPGIHIQKQIAKLRDEECRGYDAFDVQSKTGIGLFAREFMVRFPLLPVEDDVRLQDSSICENFMEIVIAGLNK